MQVTVSISGMRRVLQLTPNLGCWTDFVAERSAELPVAVVVAPVGEVLRTVRTPKRSFPGVDSLVRLEENSWHILN